MSSRRKRVLVFGAVTLAAVVVALAGTWALAFRDTATPASIDDAVARFREQAQGADLPIPPGVYVYATTGEESISALGGMRHAYPAESTITVAGGGCGVVLRWDVLTTRWSEYELCDGARRVGVWRESHRFVGQDDRTTWECAAAPWLPDDASPGTTMPYRCASADTEQEGVVTTVGTEALTVAGAPVATVHVRIEAEESGEARGPVTEERWLEPETGLPVRIAYEVRTANASPIGDVTFDERYTLDLTSLEPRT